MRADVPIAWARCSRDRRPARPRLVARRLVLGRRDRRRRAAGVDVRAIDLPSNDGALRPRRRRRRGARRARRDRRARAWWSGTPTAASRSARAPAGRGRARLPVRVHARRGRVAARRDAATSSPTGSSSTRRRARTSPPGPRTSSTPTARPTWRRPRVRDSPPSQSRRSDAAIRAGVENRAEHVCDLRAGPRRAAPGAGRDGRAGRHRAPAPASHSPFFSRPTR